MIGASRAFELLLTARKLDADEAARLGLVAEVTEPGVSVVDRAVELADSLCTYSPFGVVMTKEVMWSNLDAPSLEAAIHLENRTQILASTGGEVAEAAAAFMEKRAPRWDAGGESEP
jgi:enoyl-CoA hydratase/carnithine racemase